MWTPVALGYGIGRLWRRPAGGQPPEVLWRAGEKPARVHARAHRPITIVFARTDVNPATESVHFPDFGILAMLTPRRRTAVDIGPRAPGRYEFCSPDGGVRGWLVVEP
jgi:plastocyanin domain-containing protein